MFAGSRRIDGFTGLSVFGQDSEDSAVTYFGMATGSGSAIYLDDLLEFFEPEPGILYTPLRRNIIITYLFITASLPFFASLPKNQLRQRVTLCSLKRRIYIRR
jgi:hypothetical protein